MTDRRPTWLLCALLGLATLAAFACGGDTAPRPAAQAADTSLAATEAPPTTASPAAAEATARALPVTPVSVQYRVIDPAFEALPGARAYFGEYAGGGYQIEVPADWNGTVVYFAHGFRGNPPELTITPPPLRQYFIDHGYAWAASSYSKNGYEPGAGARDTYALRDVVARTIGAPKRQYIYGQSMGGHVTALSLELYPDAYDGALTECGALGREILDYFTSWGALAGYFTHVDLLPASADAISFGTKLKDEVYPALGGLDNLTPAGRAFVDAIEHLTGGPRPFFREGLRQNYLFNFVILFNAVAAAGPSTAAASNIGVQYAIDEGFGYTSAQINREISRVQANAMYRDAAQYPEFQPLTGRIARPHLTLHGTGDLFVPISLEQSYRRAVDAAGAGGLLVQRSVRRAGHCNFSEQERERAFADLVAWAEQGAQPAGEDLSGDLRDAGRAFTQPLEGDDPGTVSVP